MSIEIRALSEHDEAVWRSLWTGYLEFYESEVDETVYQSTFRRLLTQGEYEPNALLAWNGDEAVGLVHFMFHRHCWRIENVCYLQDLFADPSARGAGVGRALIHAVYEAADAAERPSVYWLTQEFNYRGRMLYDQVATKSPFIVNRR